MQPKNNAGFSPLKNLERRPGGEGGRTPARPPSAAAAASSRRRGSGLGSLARHSELHRKRVGAPPPASAATNHPPAHPPPARLQEQQQQRGSAASRYCRASGGARCPGSSPGGHLFKLLVMTPCLASHSLPTRAKNERERGGGGEESLSPPIFSPPHLLHPQEFNPLFYKPRGTNSSTEIKGLWKTILALQNGLHLILVLAREKRTRKEQAYYLSKVD